MTFSRMSLPALAAGLLLAIPPAFAADGYFTADQASKGQDAYNSNCSSCHGLDLNGGVGPALVGPDVMGTWGTAGGLYDFFSVAMPPTAPGQLGGETYTNILAYILSKNNIPAGNTPLADTKEARAAINLVAAASAPAPAAPAAAAAAPAAGAAPAAPAASKDPFQQANASPMPQAYTWGRSLPTVQPNGSIVPYSAQQPNFNVKGQMPQAFTWGKDLPQANGNATGNKSNP